MFNLFRISKISDIFLFFYASIKEQRSRGKEIKKNRRKTTAIQHNNGMKKIKRFYGNNGAIIYSVNKRTKCAINFWGLYFLKQSITFQGLCVIITFYHFENSLPSFSWHKKIIFVIKLLLFPFQFLNEK